MNVPRYQPLRGGTYFPLPQKLKNKKAIINVQNKDNECLKWALRASLFPAQKGKNPIRPRSYPVDDGIDYTDIVFATPVKQMDKLEAQNANLAINVFGWENDHVIVHRVSKKEAHVPRINLMLIASGEKRHYCFVKRLSALLFDQTKSHHTKHYCVMCLTGFTREDLLVNHKKYCNGVKGRPTRIEMPEEGKNNIYNGASNPKLQKTKKFPPYSPSITPSHQIKKVFLKFYKKIPPLSRLITKECLSFKKILSKISTSFKQQLNTKFHPVYTFYLYESILVLLIIVISHRMNAPIKHYFFKLNFSFLHFSILA